MLRCPKCSRIYQDGTQRFCTHDGGRLLPVSEPVRLGNTPPMEKTNIERNQTGELSFENRDRKPRQVVSSYRFVPFEETPSNKIDDEPILISQKSASAQTIKSGENPFKQTAQTDSFPRPSERLPLAANNVDLLIGQNIKGRYSLEKVLSKDSTSATYLASDRVHTTRRVMLKILLFDKTDAAFNRRFYEEKVALSHVNHPSIGGVLDAGELPDGKPFVVTEFVEGQSLRQLLQTKGQLSTTQTAKIVRQVAQALTEAHNNRILHRDLKPENIYLQQPDSGGEQVKVVNFGIGSEVDVRESNATLANLENFVYQSPEQLENNAPSPESDIFALAVIAYEMLTAQKPFFGVSPKDLLESERRGIKSAATSLRNDLQPDVNNVLARAMAHNPSQRYHLAREFGESFYQSLTEDKTIHTTQNGASNAKIETQNIVENTPQTPFQTRRDLSYQAVSSSESDATVSTQTQSQREINPINLPKKPDYETSPNESKTAKSNLPLIIGGIALASLLIGLLGYATYQSLNYMNGDNVVVQETPQNVEKSVAQNENVTPINVENKVNKIDTIEPQKLSIPPGFSQFRSSSENVNGKLAENFVGFSIAYPSKWQKTDEQETQKAGNFLDVANRISPKDPLEELFVSWYQSKGTFEADKAEFPNYAPKLIRAYGYNDKTKSGIPKLRKISEGAIKFNGRDAYEVKLEGEGVDSKGKDMKIWVRTVFLPMERIDANHGLTLTMVATSLAPALSNVDDVGTKGELPPILETLRLEN